MSFLGGFGLGYGRDNCGPRAMSSDVDLGMVSVSYLLLALVLTSSSNPIILFMSLTTLSLSCAFTCFPFKSSLNNFAAIVRKLVILSRNCLLNLQSIGLGLVRHLRTVLEILGWRPKIN